MPRKPAVLPSALYDALKKLRFIDETGNLLPWNDDVWQKAVEELGGAMSKDYVYLYLSQNRNDVLNRIHGIETLEFTKGSTHDAIADRSSNDPNWSMGETNCILPPLRQAIAISKTEWNTLKTHIVEYGYRQYEVLVIGWTDAIYDILWSHMKLPCSYAFKNARINRNPGETFLSITGHCSECESKIHIYCQTEPTEGGPTLNVSTFDSRGIVHDKKRQVRGDRRLRIGKELQGKSTYIWRREEANRLMDFGDIVPANLPSECVLRKAKQENQDKELGLFKVHAALASIWDMKYSEAFSGCIREIGLDKFYVMYWSPSQLYLYKKFKTENNVGSVSIDATGSLVKQIPNPDGSKRVVYLYQAVCSFRTKILPLFQMISEKHDANTIAYWMREWLRSGASCPKQVVTDYSPALLNATCMAFNNCDLKEYIEKCIIFEERSLSFRIKYPRCRVRVDIAHLIKLVARWKCFDRESPEKKDFYLRCIGLLTTCTEIDEFIAICTDVVTTAMATHEDIDDKESHCFAAQNRIMIRLKTYGLSIDEKDSSESDLKEQLHEFEDEETTETSSAIDMILRKIETDSIDTLKHGRLNPYHCADCGSRLMKLAKQFVLWTAVMITDEDQNAVAETGDRRVASSALSEEYFRELKNFVFKKGKAIRIDKYLVIHLRSLEGTNKLLNAPEKRSQEDTPKIADDSVEIDMCSFVDIGTLRREDIPVTESVINVATSSTRVSQEFHDYFTESINDSVNNSEAFSDSERKDETLSDNISADHLDSETSFLREIENWKGLNRKADPVKPKGLAQEKKRGKYLTACPDIEIIHKRPKFATTLPLLVNGNCLGPVKIGKLVVSVRNTCAFDSTVQSMLVAFHDFEPYSTYLRDGHFALSEFVQTLAKTSATANLYKERGSILSTTTETKNGILDCTINISHLQEKFILRDVPSLEKSLRCADCLFEVSKTLPVLHLNPLPINMSGMAGLQEAVNEACKPRSTRMCFRCQSSNITKCLSGGSHLILNIEDSGNALLSARNGYPNCRRQFLIQEIPDKLVCCDCSYKLVSTIVYAGGHYFAFIKRVTGRWEEHNDLRNKVIAVTTRTLLQPHNIHVLFYVKISTVVE